MPNNRNKKYTDLIWTERCKDFVHLEKKSNFIKEFLVSFTKKALTINRQPGGFFQCLINELIS